MNELAPVASLSGFTTSGNSTRIANRSVMAKLCMYAGSFTGAFATIRCSPFAFVA